MDDWFEVDGADDDFIGQLRELARDWPAMATTRPNNTGGWRRDGSLITYADRSDAEHAAIVASFRVDFDGNRALAARVASEHVDQGSFFSSERPEGDHPVQIASGTSVQCARAAAVWFHAKLAS